MDSGGFWKKQRLLSRPPSADTHRLLAQDARGVVSRRLLAPQYAQGSLRQSQELILPRIHQAGRDPLYPLQEEADEPRIVGDPPGEDDGIDGLPDRDGLGPNLFFYYWVC